MQPGGGGGASGCPPEVATQGLPEALPIPMPSPDLRLGRRVLPTSHIRSLTNVHRLKIHWRPLPGSNPDGGLCLSALLQHGALEKCSIPFLPKPGWQTCWTLPSLTQTRQTSALIFSLT